MTDVRYRNRFKAYKKDRTFQRFSNTRLLYSRIVLIGMCVYDDLRFREKHGVTAIKTRNDL